MTCNSEGPLVSVGIPVYNGEKFIAEALESVLKQTYANWECHVINNASNDRTEEIVSALAAKDPRIKLHTYKDFLPIVENWNRTVRHISENTRYYKLLQADDWIDTLYLEEMVRVMEKHPSIGICSSYRIDGNVVNCDGLDYYEGEFYNGREMLLRHLKEEIDITGSASTVMFRVDSLKKLPQYPEIFDTKDFHCDTQLAFDVMYVSDVGFVFKILSYTRWHPEAYTSSICVICNTFYHGKELRLYKYQHIHPSIKKLYCIHRYQYAYYSFKLWLRQNKTCMKWHRDRLTRKIKVSEYLGAIWKYNPINYRITRLLKKLKSI